MYFEVIMSAVAAAGGPARRTTSWLPVCLWPVKMNEVTQDYCWITIYYRITVLLYIWGVYIYLYHGCIGPFRDQLFMKHEGVRGWEGVQDQQVKVSSLIGSLRGAPLILSVGIHLSVNRLCGCVTAKPVVALAGSSSVAKNKPNDCYYYGLHSPPLLRAGETDSSNNNNDNQRSTYDINKY